MAVFSNFPNGSGKHLAYTTAEWAAKNPILQKGEIGFEICGDGRKLVKVGNGTTAWNGLGYIDDSDKMAIQLAGESVVSLTFGRNIGDWATAFISVQAVQDDAYALFSYNGYGIGGTQRVKVRRLSGGSTILYGIHDEDENKNHGITIKNESTVGAIVTVFMLSGKLPVVSLEDAATTMIPYVPVLETNHASRHASGGADPITPNMIGAVKKSGDGMTGPIDFVNMDNFFALTKGRKISSGKTSFLSLGVAFGGNAVIEHYTCDTEEFDSTKVDGRLELGSDPANNTFVLTLREDNADGKTYRIYGEHFKPTPAAIGAIPATGGTVDGNITAASDTTTRYFSCDVGSYDVRLLANTAGNRGVYDNQTGSWLLLKNSSNKVTLNGFAAAFESDAIKQVSTTVTTAQIAKGGYLSSQTTKATEVTGYEPFAVIAVQSNSSYVLPYYYFLSNPSQRTIGYSIRNLNTSEAITPSLTFHVLYRKSTV